MAYGKQFSKQGGKQRDLQLTDWKEGKNSVWNFEVNLVEVNKQLLKKALYGGSDYGGMLKKKETRIRNEKS